MAVGGCCQAGAVLVGGQAGDEDRDGEMMFS